MNEKYSKSVVGDEVNVDADVIGDPIGEGPVANVDRLVLPPHVDLKRKEIVFNSGITINNEK